MALTHAGSQMLIRRCIFYEVDWRDFFPYLKWIPNNSFEMMIEQMHFRRQAVMNALIKEQKKRIALGKVAFLCLKSTNFF